MKAFEGKIIKLYCNAQSGYVIVTGKFIDMDNDFIVLENNFTKKIQYFSKYFIKYIEIVKEVEAGIDEYNN